MAMELCYLYIGHTQDNIHPAGPLLCSQGIILFSHQLQIRTIECASPGGKSREGKANHHQRFQSQLFFSMLEKAMFGVIVSLRGSVA